MHNRGWGESPSPYTQNEAARRGGGLLNRFALTGVGFESSVLRQKGSAGKPEGMQYINV